MGTFNKKIVAEFNPPRKWILDRVLSYENKDIDSESLENITKIDLLKKKKKQAQDPEITSQNKTLRKKQMFNAPKKASIFVKSKKTKEQLFKELEDYELQMQSFNRKKGVTEEEYRKHTSIK